MWSLFFLALSGQAHADCRDSSVVLDHRLEATVSARLELSWVQTWSVRLEDPSSCAEGILAPPGLEGAEDGGAIIAAGRLYVPPDLAPGTTVHLIHRGTASRGAHSGLFSTTPEIPTEHVEVSLTVPQWVPLSVWTDDDAHLDVQRVRSTRHAQVSWADPQGHEEVAWTTWKGWDEVETYIERQIRTRLASPKVLGPLAEGIEGRSLDALQLQAAQAVQLTGSGSWWETRSAAEILAEGRGTDAERALVLLSLLRAAGYDARPGLFSPPGRSSAPGLLPAPALVPRPAVVVQTATERLWLDPAVPWSPSSQLPSTLRGGMAWVAGDVAHPVGTSAAPVGEVRVRSSMRVLPSGGAQVHSQAALTGGALEWAMAHWSPLTTEERRAEVEEWTRHAWPNLESLDFTLEDGALSVQMELSSSFQALGDGQVGEVAPPLIPVLAPRVPPGTRLTEELTVEAPEGQRCTSVASDDLPPSPDLSLRRKAWLDDSGRAHIHLDAYPRTTPALDALALTARSGSPVLVFAPEPKQLHRSLKHAELFPLGERLVLTSLAWWEIDEGPKASRILSRAVKKAGWDEVVRLLSRYSRHDQRPWEAMNAMAPSDEARIGLIKAMATHGHRREAWRWAGMLSRSLDHQVRAEALVLVARLQGWRPNAREDREAHDAWRPPLRILRAAARVEVPDATPSGPPVVLLPLAEVLLSRGEVEEALPVLDDAAPQEGPWLQALRAEARALDDSAPAEDVLAEVQAAVDAAPRHPRVLASASRAALRLHRPGPALQWSIRAALASNEVLDWLTASDLALALGDLPAALAASRRASDMIPTGSVPGITLHVLATLAGDAAQAKLGTERSAYEALPFDPLPAPWEKVDSICTVEHRLALLRFRDTDVRASAELLAERARLYRDAGLWQDLGRDGWLLAHAHHQRAGWGDYWVGLASCCWSTTSGTALDASRDRVRRMEWRLITGTGDPVSDARTQPHHPRAEQVIEARYHPSDLAASLGWPPDLPDPRGGAPRGFRPSRVLSGAPGVRGWTDPERAMALIRTSGRSGALPPPLSALYTLGRPQATLPGGGLLYQLEGGEAPLFAAIQHVGEEDVIGLAFTRSGARTALALAQEGPPGASSDRGQR